MVVGFFKDVRFREKGKRELVFKIKKIFFLVVLGEFCLMFDYYFFCCSFFDV